MSISIIHTAWTVLVFVIFIGIVIWAWSSRQKKSFEEAANLPFAEDRDDATPLPTEEKSNG